MPVSVPLSEQTARHQLSYDQHIRVFAAAYEVMAQTLDPDSALALMVAVAEQVQEYEAPSLDDEFLDAAIANAQARLLRSSQKAYN